MLENFDTLFFHVEVYVGIKLMNSDTFKIRLELIKGGLSNRAFGEKCGLSEGALRNYLRGSTFPPLDTLEVMAKSSGVSLAWLATGEGEMRRGEGREEIQDRELQATASGPDSDDLLRDCRLIRKIVEAYEFVVNDRELDPPGDYKAKDIANIFQFCKLHQREWARDALIDYIREWY